jgi:hypothetical protein
MRICVLGHRGFVGRSVFAELLAAGHEVVGVGRADPDPSGQFDLLVSCAGEARKWLVNRSPEDGCRAAVVEDFIVERIANIRAERVIHISSIDATADHWYGRMKAMVEREIIAQGRPYLILRLAGLVGPSLSKGPVWDLLNGHPLWVTPGSTFNIITTGEVGRIISSLMGWMGSGVMNVGALDSISVSEMAGVLGLEWSVTCNVLSEVHYNVDVSDLAKIWPVRASKKYLTSYASEFVRGHPYCGSPGCPSEPPPGGANALSEAVGRFYERLLGSLGTGDER